MREVKMRAGRTKPPKAGKEIPRIKGRSNFKAGTRLQVIMEQDRLVLFPKKVLDQNQGFGI